MSRFSIGLVIDDSLDKPDGVQQYVKTLGGWFEDQGHNVHYLASGSGTSANNKIHTLSKNIQVHFNGNRLNIPYPANKENIRKLLESMKLDVLHIQLPCSPWLAGRVVRAAPAETAVVGTFHIVPDSQLVRLSSHPLRLYEHNILNRFQSVMSVSPIAQKFARSAYGLASVVVPNVIDLKKYPKTKSRPVKSNPVTIIFLGRLVERKGCEYLLKAVVKLRDRPNLAQFRVLVAGKGPLEATLKQFVANHGLEKIVTFEGFIDESKKTDFLYVADIAVFPSTGGESFGIVLLEAMAASPGVVLAGNNEGYASVMSPHYDQLFVPSHSQLLADKLAYYINDPSARQVAHNWQTRHVKSFSVELIGPRIVDIYQQALRDARDVR